MLLTPRRIYSNAEDAEHVMSPSTRWHKTPRVLMWRARSSRTTLPSEELPRCIQCPARGQRAAANAGYEHRAEMARAQRVRMSRFSQRASITSARGPTGRACAACTLNAAHTMHSERESPAEAFPEPLTPIAMRSFADHTADFGWFAYCQGGHRDRDFSAHDIMRLFGFDADVDEVRARLRCTRCGARDCLLYRYFRGSMHGPSEGAYR